MKALAAFALLPLALASSSVAEVTVKSEQLNPADLAWKFKRIPGPSKSDIAQDAKVTVERNQLEETAGKATVLTNGRVPDNPLELAEEALLSNANANDGTLVMDLGQAQPIAAVTSCSWHENPPDHGCRGPQVYTLSGSTDGQNWTKLADVDTRPNQAGVLVSDTKGTLGTFRYLRFDTKRTRSPLQGNAGLTGTLFSEIDVHTKATSSKAGDAAVVGPVQVTDVWVVFKTHCDIGYTETIEHVLKKFRVNMMDSALAIIEAGTVLRVWEQNGDAGKLEIGIPGKFSSATPVNLRGERSGQTIRVQDGKLSCKAASLRSGQLRPRMKS